MTGRLVDVAIIGAGPSGTMAALELAKAGASVLVFERSAFPRWKVCGACVGPGALASLRAAGLGGLPERYGARPLRELEIVGAGGTSAILRLRGGVAWSRSAMDSALLDAAADAGASVRTGVRASLGPSAADGRVVRLRERAAGAVSEIRARLILDASGLGGAPHSEGDAPSDRIDESARVGLGAVFSGDSVVWRSDSATTVGDGRIVMIVGRHGYVGLVRLEDGTLDVAAAVDRSTLRGQTPEGAVARVLADVGYRLDGDLVHGWRGTPPLTRTPRSAAMDRCLRVGDALGYMEPFTGEGMGWALASARAVTPLALRALERWDAGVAADWEAYRRGSLARAQRICRAVSWSVRRPALVWLALSIMKGAPWLAAPVLDALERVPEPPRMSRRVAPGRAPVGRAVTE